MYTIKKIIKTTPMEESKRQMLLERFPRILSSKILILVFLYSIAFTLLLLGLKMLHLEYQAASSAAQLVSTTTHLASTVSPLPSTDALSVSHSVLYEQESSEEIQQNIASQIIRLHVIANSDTDSDQSLKLKVRDAIIQDLQSVLKAAPSIEVARSILANQLPEIQKKAEATIQAEGYDYPVSISLNQRYFPVKVYGDLTFPAGEYEALCLEIGEASGRNWWCVLFPSLCFVDETYAVVPEESKEKLQDSLSEKEYAALENQSGSDETGDSKENAETECAETSAKTKTSTSEKTNDSEKSGTDVQFRSGILDWIINR